MGRERGIRAGHGPRGNARRWRCGRRARLGGNLSDHEEGPRQSWKELLLELKNRGLEVDPKLAIADGAPGFWKARSTREGLELLMLAITGTGPAINLFCPSDLLNKSASLKTRLFSIQ